MQETVIVSASKGKNGLRVQKEKNTIAAAGYDSISLVKIMRQHDVDNNADLQLF